MSLVFTRQLLLVKPETVVGTDAVPTPAANAMLVRDAAITFDAQQRERPIYLPDLSNSPVRPGRITATISFTAELKGSGVAGVAPKIGTLLRGIGFSQTALPTDGGFEYDPVSTGFESLTMYLYIDGILHKVLGARGSATMTGAAGEDALMNFTFQGSYVEPTDVTFPTGIVYEETLPLLVELADLNVLGLTSCAQQFTVDIANSINPRLCVNAAEGVSGYNVTGRNVTGSLNPEATLMATFNPFAKLRSGEIGDFHAELGLLSENNRVEIDGHVQYTNVSPGNRDNTLIWDIPVRFVRDEGDDEIKFTFPQAA